MKIMTVVGARPQFIKAAVISRLVKTMNGIREIIVHTGQHYDRNMSDLFFEELVIPRPDYNLDVGSGGHGVQTGRMLERVEEVALKEQPDCILIYGDTNSTLAGALVGAKLHIPVAHVEAGLRSFNRKMPEEINRIVADHVADILFPPTALAVKNLKSEGFSDSRIHCVGDVMYDAALFYAERSDGYSTILETLGIRGRDFILATVHRAENTDDPVRLAAILGAFVGLAKDQPIVLPLHPRTRGMLSADMMARIKDAGILLIDPVGYLDMIMLEKSCGAVVTDSGGVQKEAFFYRKPCITLRDETEWVELVDMGWNRLCPPLSEIGIMAAVRAALGSSGVDGAPYGKGDAGRKILAVLQQAL